MRCPSGKTGYTNRVEALIHLTRKSQWYDKPMRAYRCPDCRRWHLTTKRVKQAN